MELEVYRQVKATVQKLIGINLDHYKDEQMRRRLDAWLSRSGSVGWDEYFIRIKKDDDELTRFRNYLTINVTEFFRDFERWQYLQKNILPELLRDSIKLRVLGAGLRVWCAGCSIGAEPYSLGMLLEELAPARRHYLLATDLDRGALMKARAGGPYLAEEIKNVSAERRAAFFKTQSTPFYIKDNLIKKVGFVEQNLLADPFEKDFDLIICRNVVIYFTGETKDMLYQKFFNALRPGGVMFVGGTEIIPRPQEIGFRSYGISFYIKN